MIMMVSQRCKGRFYGNVNIGCLQKEDELEAFEEYLPCTDSNSAATVTPVARLAFTTK